MLYTVHKDFPHIITKQSQKPSFKEPVILTKCNHVSLEIDIADNVPRPTVVDRHLGCLFDSLEDSTAVDGFKGDGWDVSLCVNMGQG